MTFTDLAAPTAVTPRLIEGGHRNTRKQSANTVRTREVEEEIGIQRVIRDPGAVTLGTEIKDVTALARADRTLRIVREEKIYIQLDPHPERSREVLLAAHSRISRKLTRRKTKP